MDAFRQKLDLEKMIREQILDGKDFVFSIPFCYTAGSLQKT